MAMSPTLAGGDKAVAATAAVAVSPAAGPAPAAPQAAPAAPSVPQVDGMPIPPERLRLRPVLVQVAHEYGLPTDLVLAQAWVESSWRVHAVSPAQATGVLQLTPATVDFISHRLLKLDHTLDPLDPLANARMGARFMQHLLNRTSGDLRMALIAYNQGLTALLRNGPYDEAVAYADRVLALRPQFA
jgi:soluble lytic murein transglycosylase-like protein